jgi:large subunit ribosomal protein L23
MSVRDHRDVLLAPVISEKSYGLLDENQYTFIVLPEANKTQIKIAVEQVFNVKVLGVNTINRQGKRKRARGNPRDSATENRPPAASVNPVVHRGAGEGETVV